MISLWLLLLGCPRKDELEHPSLEILTPLDQGIVCGTPLHVELAIENFQLIPLEDGSTPEPGTGHVDMFLNGQELAMDAGESFDIPDVEPGVWQLRAELVYANHQAVEPYAGDFVFITVDPNVCEEP